MAGLFDAFNPLQRLPAQQFRLAESTTPYKGSLISFSYPESYAKVPNVIHDPKPMVIVCDIYPKFLTGVNLHYLDFQFVQHLLWNWGGNTSFSYKSISADRLYMARAFRMYVRQGIRQPRKLDVEWLKQVLVGVRSFNPGEIEKIKANIQKQIQARLQAKAKELASYEQWRKQLSDAQKRQLRGKVFDVHQAVSRGQQQNLIKPVPEGHEPFSVDEFGNMLGNENQVQ